MESARPGAQAIVRLAAVASRGGADGAGRLRGRHCGLGHHRSRTTALHGLRAAAHGRLAVAAGGACGGRLAGDVRAGVLHGVQYRRGVHRADDGAAAYRGGARAAAHPAACGGHHAGVGHRSAARGCAVSLDLPIVWALILAFVILAYVVMDGFDLGIGILFPTLAVGPERDRAMNAIAPVWDGNETWLGGA